MFLDDQRYTQSGKTYRRVLLRNSYRVSVGTRSYIIMLSYLLAYQIQRLWYYIVELTVEEGIKELVSICTVEGISPDGQLSYQTISETKELDKVLLAKIGISPPPVIPCHSVNVDTRTKLVSGIKTKKFQVVNPKK